MKTLVDVAHFAPGCCMVCMTSAGPFVDLGIETDFESRAYLCVTCIGETAELVGGCTPQARGALEEQVAGLEGQLEDAWAKITQVGVELEKAEQLRSSVAFTLEHGAVADKRTGKIKLRAVPGTKAVDASQPIELPGPSAA